MTSRVIISFSTFLTAWLAAQLLSPSAAASEVSGRATLTSQYIYRGLKMSDGDPALQLGIDYEHNSGLFGGAWASTVDLSSSFGQRDTELDYYAGFHFDSDAPVSATVTVLRYTYPGQTGRLGYDYTEVLVSANWHEHHSIEYGYASNLYGLDRIGRHWQLRSEWPVANAWVIGAGLGGNDMSDIGVSRYLHWDVGASARFSYLTFDLRWYDNQATVGFAGAHSAGSQIVLSISAAF
jgi:uncharacterized protein (TIGR02001 family)